MELIKQHPAETLVEWGAPALLAGAAAWAAWTVGHSPVVMSAVAAVAMCVGLAAMRVFGGATSPLLSSFDPVVFDICGDESAADELLLDDPLEITPDSRVVRLFARQEATPGELLLRIEDYLNDGQRAPAPVAAAGDNRPADATASLHEALANIRASLR